MEKNANTFVLENYVLEYYGFFLETYQAAKFIERDGEFQVEDDLDTGEVVTMYITICIHNMYYICICRLNY